MTRFRIVAVTVAAVIVLAAWWVRPEAGSGDGCPVGACAEDSPAPGVSGGPDSFYGGEGPERIREGGYRPDASEGTGGGDVIHCGPDRYEARQSCEEIRARFY